jgi:hypothetical protein
MCVRAIYRFVCSGGGVLLYFFASGITFQQACAADPAQISSIMQMPAPVAHSAKWANFEGERASRNARQVADWVVDSGDNHGLPFALVDKIDAKVFVFDANGRLRGATAALLGLALGDDAIPGIGNRKLASILPEERTTPAGRFIASMGSNTLGKTILWVDYENAISMHPVITTNPEERRAQRLASPTPLDNRISYGCINVPAKFFENVVRPAFTGTDGIVYVLPETKPAREVFSLYVVGERILLPNAHETVPEQSSPKQLSSRQPGNE